MRKKLAEWWNRPRLISIFAKQRRPQSTSKLYVLHVDFPVKEETARALERSFAAVSEKYGIQIMILEPGMHLRRFDDI